MGAAATLSASRWRGIAAMTTSLVRDVILRDGSALRLRSPKPADEGAIRAFFDGLRPESRYMRFHGAGRTTSSRTTTPTPTATSGWRSSRGSAGGSSPSRATTD